MTRIEVPRQEVYFTIVYNGNPNAKTEIPIPFDALDFFGLQKMTGNYKNGHPVIGFNDGTVALREEVTHGRSVFIPTKTTLRETMHQYLVMSQGPSI